MPIASVKDNAWAQAARAAFEKEGHRTGGARSQILELLARQRCCLSAHEISERLRAGKGSVGLASVYRTLDILHGAGLLQRVDIGEGATRYEPILPGGEHHHHVVCDSCGRIEAFEDAALERAIHRLGKRLGHAVGAHEVLIHGSCGRCGAAPG